MEAVLNQKIIISIVSEEHRKEDDLWRITYDSKDTPCLIEYFKEEIMHQTPVHCKVDALPEFYIIIKNISLSVSSHLDSSDEAYIDPKLYGDIANNYTTKESRQQFLKKQFYGKIVFTK